MSQNEKHITAPPTFKDAQGRTWTIKLTLDLIDKVQAAHQLDLAPDNNDLSPVTSLLSRTRLLGKVLWTCCQNQAESDGVTSGDLQAELDGAALFSGWEAMVDAIVFFIQSLRGEKSAQAVREALKAEMRVMETQAEVIIQTITSSQTDEEVKKAAERIGKEMQRELARELSKVQGASATS